MGAKLDLVFLVSSIIEMTAGLITLFEPEITFDAIGHGMGRQAARAWGAAVLSFGLAIYLGWRDEYPQSASRRGLAFAMVLYNGILAWNIARATLAGGPIMGTPNEFSDALRTLGGGIGVTIHVGLLIWAVLWLNESGRHPPAVPYIANLPKRA